MVQADLRKMSHPQKEVRVRVILRIRKRGIENPTTEICRRPLYQDLDLDLDLEHEFIGAHSVASPPDERRTGGAVRRRSTIHGQPPTGSTPRVWMGRL